MMDEALNIANLMDAGNPQAAADELASDLYAMRGDRYSQDELLSAVNVDDRKGVGADIQLGNWNPDNGTWDNINIVPNDGTPAIPIPVYNFADPSPWDQP